MRLMIDRGSVIIDYLDRLGRKDSYKAKFDALSKAVDNATAIKVVPYGEYKALEQRVRELEKRLADVNSSPFDGGVSQAEYFNGARRAVWLFAGRTDERNIFKCSECGCTAFTKESEPNFPQCPECGRAMNGGVSDG